MKSKKMTISLMLFLVFLFGTIFSIIGLIFFINRNKEINNNEYTRFSISEKIKKDEKSIGIINALIDKPKTINNKHLVFKDENNLYELEAFFKSYLKTSFDLNNDYETKLKIHNFKIQDYNISFSVSWYFQHKFTYIMYKNTKYYDMLKLIYKGQKNESKDY